MLLVLLICSNNNVLEKFIPEQGQSHCYVWSNGWRPFKYNCAIIFESRPLLSGLLVFWYNNACSIYCFFVLYNCVRIRCVGFFLLHDEWVESHCGDTDNKLLLNVSHCFQSLDPLRGSTFLVLFTDIFLTIFSHHWQLCTSRFINLLFLFTNCILLFSGSY